DAGDRTPGSERPCPRADSRRAPEPGRAAGGLRVRRALPARETGLRRHAASASRRGGPPPRPPPPRLPNVRAGSPPPRPRGTVMTRFIGFLVVAAVSLALASGASAEGTVRIGMTAADIPYTGGQTDNGFEGFRFVGYQIYEPLINWDLSRSDKLPSLVPGLA